MSGVEFRNEDFRYRCSGVRKKKLWTWNPKSLTPDTCNLTPTCSAIATICGASACGARGAAKT
ncbi:MAG: hypothetical protein JRJ85_02605 [Deltaproteobacteria bacterium]|nr:hypothetical protein [Deltaproteobacteria bacterium]